MNCKNCGNPLPIGSVSCPNCGTSVNDIKSIKEIQNSTNEPIFHEKKKGQEKEKKEEPVINNVDFDDGTKKNIIITVIVIAAVLIVFGIILYSTLGPSGTPKQNQTNTEKMVVGNDNTGYLTLSGKWTEVTDEQEPDVIVYSKDDWKVTLDSFETEEHTAEEAARTVYFNISTSNDNVSDVEITTIKVAKYDGYAVTSYYKDRSMWITNWYFSVGDGKIYHIQIEGPESASENYLIPSTFSVEK